MKTIEEVSDMGLQTIFLMGILDEKEMKLTCFRVKNIFFLRERFGEVKQSEKKIRDIHYN
jgi:hypothetical protein